MPNAPVLAPDKSTIVRSFKPPVAYRIRLGVIATLSRVAASLENEQE